ncbi:MAG: hypothetical protein IKM72_04370, partial [Oscillospiraceae bacterium]|nr:hypothetical protein [Oscillospiraceae bacterium]
VGKEVASLFAKDLNATFCPIASVETAIANGFSDMVGLDLLYLSGNPAKPDCLLNKEQRKEQQRGRKR